MVANGRTRTDPSGVSAYHTRDSLGDPDARVASNVSTLAAATTASAEAKNGRGRARGKDRSRTPGRGSKSRSGQRSRIVRAEPPQTTSPTTPQDDQRQDDLGVTVPPCKREKAMPENKPTRKNVVSKGRDTRLSGSNVENSGNDAGSSAASTTKTDNLRGAVRKDGVAEIRHDEETAEAKIKREERTAERNDDAGTPETPISVEEREEQGFEQDSSPQTETRENSGNRQPPENSGPAEEGFWKFFGFANERIKEKEVQEKTNKDVGHAEKKAGIWNSLIQIIDPAPDANADSTTTAEQTLPPHSRHTAGENRSVGNDEESQEDEPPVNLFGDDFKSMASVKDDDAVRRNPQAEDPSNIETSEVELEVDDIKILQPDPVIEAGANRHLPEAPRGVVDLTKQLDGETELTHADIGGAANDDTLTLADISALGKETPKKKVDQNLESRRVMLVEELRAAIAAYGRYDLRCANISAALGDVLDQTEEYEQAVRLHMDASTIYSCKLGDDHTTTMNSKVRLGKVLENAGHYDEAIKTFYLVTVMLRTLKGEQFPAAADGLVHMASVLRKKGDYMQAIKELKKALKVYRDALGDSHGKVSATVDEIASLYVTIGDFEKSAAILEEVVKLKAATLGSSSKEVAQTLSTLATTYECSEEFGQAMKALKKAYKIYTELDGYSSADATTTLDRIAHLYEATNDYNRASIAYLGVLRGRKIIHGSDHLLVGETYYRLGHALRETGQAEKAIKCMREALPIYVGKSVEMNDVKMIAEIMNEMASLNKQKKHFKDAARIYKQEISVRRKIGQPEYPQVARALNSLGEVEFELHNNSRALKYLVEALTIFQKNGEQGLDCAEVLYNTGLVFEAVRNRERALEAFVEAARIFKEQDTDGGSQCHHWLLKANMKIDEIRARMSESSKKKNTTTPMQK